jgi:hypothetical protein
VSRRARPSTDRRPQRALAAAIAIFIVARLYILFGLTPLASDLSVYFANVVRASQLGLTPYSRELVIEFPPVAWWVMRAAGEMAPADEPLRNVDAARRSYMQSYRQLMVVADVVAFVLFLAIVRRRRPASAGIAALLYVVPTSILGHVLYDRMDIAVLLFILAAAYAWLRSRDHNASPMWTVAAYGLAALGANLKIVPGLLLPFLFLGDLRLTGARGKRAVAGTVGALVGLVAPMAIQYALSGPGVFDLFAFHAERGVQLESSFATIMAAGGLFGFPVSISLWEGGANLTSALAPALKTISLVCVLLWLAVLGGWAAFGLATDRQAQPYRLGLLAIAGVVALSSVLSPQYFLWALPALVLVACEAFDPGDARRPIVWAAFIAVAALTTWVFPYHYFGFTPNPVGLEVGSASLASPSQSTLLLLGIRNVLYVSLVATITVKLWRSERRP